MRSDPGVSDSLHQLGVFVDQPGFPQHVRRSVLQLKDKQTEFCIKHNWQSSLNKQLFSKERNFFLYRCTSVFSLKFEELSYIIYAWNFSSHRNSDISGNVQLLKSQ